MPAVDPDFAWLVVVLIIFIAFLWLAVRWLLRALVRDYVWLAAYLRGDPTDEEID